MDMRHLLLSISSEPEVRTIICKASFNTSPEVMNAYGQHGVIGLSVMGKNLALNVRNHGFSVSGFSIDKPEVDAFAKYEDDKLKANGNVSLVIYPSFLACFKDARTNLRC